MDGVTWGAYGQDLEANLSTCTNGYTQGATGRPPRRVSSRRQTAAETRSASPRWRTRSSQRPLSRVLDAIYEQDFLGFS